MSKLSMQLCKFTSQGYNTFYISKIISKIFILFEKVLKYVFRANLYNFDFSYKYPN